MEANVTFDFKLNDGWTTLHKVKMSLMQSGGKQT